MRRAGAFATLLAVAASLWGSATPARACSGPGWDYLMEHATLIVEGRITGWDVATDIPSPSWGSTPIRVRLAVSRTYKGAASQEHTLLDKWSLTRLDGQDAWVTHTTCPNPFASDPMGKAGIVGIIPDDFDGEYPFVFFIGDSLSGEQYRQVVSALVTALPPGGGTPDKTAGYPVSAPALIVVGSVLAILGAASLVFPAKGSRM